MEDIEALMPRTKVANDRARVDARKLKEFMAIKRPQALPDAAVQRDVRKDAEGFDDVDDFWADEESLEDDSVDDDDSLTASDKDDSVQADTSADLSGSSDQSEHEVELAEISSPLLDDRESMEIQKGSIPPRTSQASRASRGSRGSRGSVRVEEEKKDEAGPPGPPEPAAPPSPVRSDVSFDFGGGSPNGSADMNDVDDVNDVNVTVRDRRSKGSLGKDKDKKGKAKEKARRPVSFGDVRGFVAEVASPFSVNEGSVTPLSNASDRTLKSIPSFTGKDSVSPSISKELFKKGGYTSDASEASAAKKKTKPEKKTKTTKKTKMIKQRPLGRPIGRPKTPRLRPTGKYGYRTTPPATDSSTQSVQTDDSNDESYQTVSDTGGETGDDSFFNQGDTPTGPVRDRLPDASRILDELKDDSDSSDDTGLRRSKRKRFKPLAWFKSEHMVYERTFVGVGAVMPTVVGVERLGADSPKASERKKPKPPSKRINSGRALTLDELPADVRKRIVDGEWATLFDSQAGCMNDLNIICRSSEIRLRKLPTEERGGAVVHAYAGQSFNLFSPAPFARWISGRVVLPPGAWKEPEGIGAAVQLFYVTGCQPKSLELALAPETDDDFFTSKHTTHFLLSAGDEFYVPAGNVYYVKNHSRSADCDLRFTILKPEAPPVPSDDNDSDAEKKDSATKPEEEEIETNNSALKRKREEDADSASSSSV